MSTGISSILQQEISANQGQRTPDWYKIRLTRFTSSEMFRLYTRGSRPMTQEELDARPKGPQGGLLDKRTTVSIEFGDTALSYIREKVAEQMTGQQTSVQTKDTEWGVEYEGPALHEFAELYSAEGRIEFPGFLIYGKHAGGSPDGLFEQTHILEVKCPSNPAIHIENLGLNAETFKDKRPNYWHQIQSNIVMAEAHYQRKMGSGIFISYDPRLAGTQFDHLKLFVMEVAKDLEYKATLDDKLEKAAKIKEEMLQKLIGYLPPATI